VGTLRFAHPTGGRPPPPKPPTGGGTRFGGRNRYRSYLLTLMRVPSRSRKESGVIVPWAPVGLTGPDSIVTPHASRWAWISPIGRSVIRQKSPAPTVAAAAFGSKVLPAS